MRYVRQTHTHSCIIHCSTSSLIFLTASSNSALKVNHLSVEGHWKGRRIKEEIDRTDRERWEVGEEEMRMRTGYEDEGVDEASRSSLWVNEAPKQEFEALWMAGALECRINGVFGFVNESVFWVMRNSINVMNGGVMINVVGYDWICLVMIKVIVPNTKEKEIIVILTSHFISFY